MYRSNIMRYKLINTVLMLAIAMATISAVTAEQIVREMDALETFGTSYSEGGIVTTDRFGKKTSTFKAWSRGAYDSLIEFTSVAERGQKILRTEGELYLFYPDAEELIRLQGAALRQSMLGSDISYEDMTGEKDTLAQYDVKLLRNEVFKRPILPCVAVRREDRTVAYPRQSCGWTRENLHGMAGRVLKHNRGRLLKEMEVLETMEADGRTLPGVTRISDKMKRDSATEMRLVKLDIDISLDPAIFTLQNLTW